MAQMKTLPGRNRVGKHEAVLIPDRYRTDRYHTGRAAIFEALYVPCERSAASTHWISRSRWALHAPPRRAKT